LRQTLLTARSAGFDSISFLAADVTSSAFNRPETWDKIRQAKVALDKDQVALLEDEVERLIREHGSEIESGFVRESPEKLRRIVHHFRAQVDLAEPVSPKCNAPWVSAVVESDGTVRPCFFHKSIGNIGDASLLQVINGPDGIRFRDQLDVAANPTCRRCVCSLYWPL
jgi:MoaA/NifB/PqqE/SkfB family radical SAM enzyme